MDFMRRLRAEVKLQVMPIVAPAVCSYGMPTCDDSLCDYTIFGAALTSLGATEESIGEAVRAYVASDAAADAAVGAMLGQAIGDALGAPLEFLDADELPAPRTQDEARAAQQRFKQTREGRESWLLVSRSDEPPRVAFEFMNECNKFALQRGQWTDDAAMALCLADSMIARGEYEGGDCRARYFNWWFHGYNNAFRLDPTRSYGRTSVGLGGNISKSIENLFRFVGKHSTAVPARFESTGEDAGNGSIMRLSPLPVRYHSNVFVAMAQAAESSLATHPGPDAAACCQFIAFYVCRAIHRDRQRGEGIASFTDATINEFLAFVEEGKIARTSGIEKLTALLRAAPPRDTERCWCWRTPGPLEIGATIKARGRRYNGYPVIPGYFGSYCMDGLAMALWAMHRTTTFADAMVSVVNLLGDCDTTGAICGQMVGAFYGHSGICSDPVGDAMWRDVHTWDRSFEWELRALWLFEDGCTSKTQVA